MAKCNKCNVEILDETEVCPLCMSILQQTDPVENMYPDVRLRVRNLTLFCNIYLFLAICLESALVVINLLTDARIMWCLIPGLAMLYFYLVLRYAILGKSGHRSKIVVLILWAVLSAVAVDMAIDASFSTDFQYTDEYKWLMDNAWKFGFILRFPADKTNLTTISFEPWHWRYVGRYHAKKIHDSGICLEEYIALIEKE